VPDVAADAAGTTGMALAFSAAGCNYDLVGEAQPTVPVSRATGPETGTLPRRI
jgi:hypothetical protein